MIRTPQTFLRVPPLTPVAPLYRDHRQWGDGACTAPGGALCISEHARHVFWVGRAHADENPTLDRACAPTLGQSEITDFRRSAGRAHDLWEGAQGYGGLEGEYIGYIEPNSDERGPPSCVAGAPKPQLTVIKHRAARSAWCSKKHAVFAGVAPGTALSLLL